MRSASYHTPVLRDEALSLLITSLDGVYVDATLGGGGHAEAILQSVSPSGMLIGFDADQDALQHTTARLSQFSKQAIFVNANFRNLESVLQQRGINRVSGILFDLGVSSHQLDEPTKGFSYRSDERLDMRMDRTQRLDAREIANHYTERELADLFWKYGEEKASRRIARMLVRRRAKAPMETTRDLSGLVEEVIGQRFLAKTLSRIFQALRIEVNNELEHLREALAQSIGVLQLGGRLVVISYHSLEDRIVKETFRQAAATSRPSGHKLIPDTTLQPTLKILTKKPIEASEAEMRANSRARSAKLRAAERLS